MQSRKATAYFFDFFQEPLVECIGVHIKANVDVCFVVVCLSDIRNGCADGGAFTNNVNPKFLGCEFFRMQQIKNSLQIMDGSARFIMIDVAFDD